jgi:ABC-type glycerol-3-phosphate transport system substrate-binding protein
MDDVTAPSSAGGSLMVRSSLALPLVLVGAAAVGLTSAGPSAAGGGVSCSFATTSTAAVTSVTMPAPVRAGSTVAAVVTIARQAGATGPVEVTLAPGSWTRTNACVVVPAGASGARFDVTVSPVTTDGRYARVGAYATADGADLRSATSLIVRR